MISADDLKEAVLHVLRQKSNLSAMDISRQVWPPPTLAEDDDRSFMKVKVSFAH